MSKICSRCHVERDVSCFLSNKNKPTKQCRKCNDTANRYKKYGKTRSHITEHIFNEKGECKRCSKCKNIFLLSDFRKESNSSDKLNSQCNHCRKAYMQLEETKKKLSVQRKIHYQKNIKEMRRKQNERSRKYLEKRRKEDPTFKIKHNLRERLRKIVSRGGATKTNKTLVILGCSFEYFMDHIESKFTEGMSWENYGRKKGRTWEMDHIKPCAEFDMTNNADQLACFHYTNIQPMWANENRTKSDNWSLEDEEYWEKYTSKGLELLYVENEENGEYCLCTI